jgi:hypothetical protein
MSCGPAVLFTAVCDSDPRLYQLKDPRCPAAGRAFVKLAFARLQAPDQCIYVLGCRLRAAVQPWLIRSSEELPDFQLVAS